jgi:hypothetical protein
LRKRSSTKQLPDHTFFTDRDLGHQVPAILKAAGLNVERHDDHFAPLTPDTTWLRAVGQRGWIALSHNKGIRYNTGERDMAMRASAALFFLIGSTTHEILARNFVQSLDRVEEFLAVHQRPFIARIYRPTPVSAVADGKPGRVDMWLSLEDWRDLSTRGET